MITAREKNKRAPAVNIEKELRRMAKHIWGNIKLIFNETTLAANASTSAPTNGTASNINQFVSRLGRGILDTHGAGGWYHDDYSTAATKSEWFWLVVPAVIVVGAAIIILPLIAAFFVSMITSGSAYSLSMGRKRRKRDLTDDLYNTMGARLLDMYAPMTPASVQQRSNNGSNRSSTRQQTTNNVMSLIKNLSQFHRALENVEKFIASYRSPMNRSYANHNKKRHTG